MEKLTTAQTELLNKLPSEFIHVEEQVGNWRIGPAKIYHYDAVLPVEGQTVYEFGKGDAQAFKGLLSKGYIERIEKLQDISTGRMVLVFMKALASCLGGMCNGASVVHGH